MFILNEKGWIYGLCEFIFRKFIKDKSIDEKLFFGYQRVEVGRGGYFICKSNKRIFQGDGNVLYEDCGVGYIILYSRLNILKLYF